MIQAKCRKKNKVSPYYIHISKPLHHWQVIVWTKKRKPNAPLVLDQSHPSMMSEEDSGELRTLIISMPNRLTTQIENSQDKVLTLIQSNQAENDKKLSSLDEKLSKMKDDFNEQRRDMSTLTRDNDAAS